MFKYAMIAYLLAALLYFGIRYRHNKQDAWMRFVLAAALPVVGLVLPVYWPKRWHDRNAEKQRKDGTNIFDQLELQMTDQAGIYQMPDADKEMNIVPLEEALLVNDLSVRRRVVIDLLKKDSLDYLEVLQMAVNNEDTETSHYAVSAIIEVKRKLTLTLQELAVKYEENRDDPYLLRSYADVLKGMMRSGFHDERTMLKHQYTYTMVLEQYLTIVPDSPDVYDEKIETDLALHEYANAERTAKRYIEQFPRREDAYLSLIKVYFTMRSRDQFQQTLEKLKNSQVRMSNRTLSVVRFWSEGVQDGFQSKAEA